MRVFVTGATGWIGSHLVTELLANGHQVTGLARSDEGAAKLEAAGAEVVRGTLDDVETIVAAATSADAVAHLGYRHDMAFTGGFEKAAVLDGELVDALGEALAGTGKPFGFASGTAVASGEVVTEQTEGNPAANPRAATEQRALALADKGVHAIAFRFPPTVHGTGDHGFIASAVGMMKANGAAGYVGDGANSWAAVHVTDAARACRLALESAPAGTRIHAVAETGVATKDIAAAIAAGTGLPLESVGPDDAAAKFSWLAMFWGSDLRADSTATRQLLGWEPTGRTLIEDIPDYLG